jgi:hypothetical protein
LSTEHCPFSLSFHAASSKHFTVSGKRKEEQQGEGVMMLQTPRQPYLCFSASIRATASALGPFRVPWSERGGDGERLGEINKLYAKAA